MDFARLLDLVGDEPVFESALLLAGRVDVNDVHRQLSRWSATGRVVQLRRGVYALGRPYRKSEPHPFVVANLLAHGSYVSMESALAYYGLIPEHVPLVTSVTVARPARFETPLGRFEFRHVHERLLFGYQSVEVAAGQSAFVATPEKALLDLAHLRPGAATPRFVEGLRLQNLDRINRDELARLAARASRPKLRRFAELAIRAMEAEAEEYTTP